jgi:hypothetical protein
MSGEKEDVTLVDGDDGSLSIETGTTEDLSVRFDDDEDTGLGQRDDDDVNEGAEERSERRASHGQERRRKRREYTRNDQHLVRTLANQLAMTTNRLQQIEGRIVDMDVNTLIGTRQALERQARQAQAAHARAVDAGNGTEATQAVTAYNEAVNGMRHYDGLIRQRQQHAQQIQRPAEQAPEIDPAVAANIQAFIANNPWYDPEGGDEDSAIVNAFDAQVAKKYDPATPEYWNELERRSKRALPHRYEGVVISPDRDESTGKFKPSQDAAPRGGPRTGGRTERKPGSITIPPEVRKEWEAQGVDLSDKATVLALATDYARIIAEQNGKRR